MSGPQYFFSTVTGDTIMSNGKQYKTILHYTPWIANDGYEYFRNDNNLQYKYFGDSTICPSQEYIKYDFSSKDSAFWPICNGFMGADYLSCLQTFNDYSTVFNQDVQTKAFVYVSLAFNDTIYGPEFTGITHVSKNIGVT